MNDFSSFLGAHTLWEFPILTMKFGGVVFILIYLVMFLLLGTPLLLLEMTIGQYSALSPTKLYRNLCPVSESKMLCPFYYTVQIVRKISKPSKKGVHILKK